jgi:hypothetical protein
LIDNTYFDKIFNPNEKDEQDPLKKLKPFYYTINDKNIVERHQKVVSEPSVQDLLLGLIDKSEILKRMKELYLRYKQLYAPCDPNVTFYKIGTKQIEVLQTVLRLNESSNLLQFLKKNKGKSFTQKELDHQLTAYDQNAREMVKRVLEDRYFWSSWKKEDFELAKPDATSYQWRLYFGLIGEMKRIADSINANLAIFSATDEEQYQWEVMWYWINNDETSKRNFFEQIDLIKGHVSKIGVQFIDGTVGYQRARNDFHPTIVGNESMAEDIYKFLMANYKNTLDKFKKPPQ